MVYKYEWKACDATGPIVISRTARRSHPRQVTYGEEIERRVQGSYKMEKMSMFTMTDRITRSDG